MSENNLSQDIEEALQGVVDHQDELLAKSEPLKTIFEENYSDRDIFIRSEDLQHGIRETLALIFDEEEIRHTFANRLSWLVRWNTNPLPLLRERGASDDFLQFISELRSKHNGALQDIHIGEYQGEKYWKRVYTDYVMRGASGVPGMDHRIILGKNREVEVTTSLSSHQGLINLLVRKQISALDHFGEEGENYLDESEVEELDNAVEELKERMGMTDEDEEA